MRKLRPSVLCTILSFLVVLASAGCSMGMNDMFDNYNSKFQSGQINVSQDPDNPDFDPSYLLLPHYAVRSDATLTLEAPSNCESYTWKMYERTGEDYDITPLPNDPEAGWNTDVSRHTRVINLRAAGVSDNLRVFSFYVPSVNIATGTYKLELTVEKKFGNEIKTWSDYCTLVIFTPVKN